MDDSRCLDFFCRPTQTCHRRYEALRAVFIDGRGQKEVAEVYGFSYGSMRQWVRELRQHCRDAVEESPFFKS
jgi:DNA-directed RNA polymerase specialized sigma24 family protein